MQVYSFLREEEFKSLPLNKTFTCLDFKGRERRFMRKEGNEVLILDDGCRKYGTYIDEDKFFWSYRIPSSVMESDKKWRKRLTATVKRMEKSGLNPEYKKFFENLLSSGMTLEDLDAICSLRDSIPETGILDEDAETYFFPYSDEYPFIIYEPEGMAKQLIGFFEGVIPNCETKTMWFGDKNDEIKEKIRNKTPGRFFSKAGYTLEVIIDKDGSAIYIEKPKHGPKKVFVIVDENKALKT